MEEANETNSRTVAAMSDTTFPGSDVPFIDLYNLDDPKFQTSKYVLTSPRSLEACANLDIKPASLLYKSLADFQDEHEPKGVPLRAIYAMYDEFENNRQKNLALCRCEQDQAMKEESERKNDILITTNKSHDEKRDEEKDLGSLQRMRTAMALSETSRGRDVTCKSARPLVPFRTSTPVGSTRSRTRSVTRDDRSRSRSIPYSELKYAKQTPLGRKSMENLTIISNGKLRRKLKDLKNVSVSREDQKILECLMTKHENEKKFYEQRTKANLEWDEKYRLELAEQDEMENSRRSNLAKRYSQWQKHRVQKKEQRDRDYDTTLVDLEKSIIINDEKVAGLLDKQQKSRVRQINEKRWRDSEKKKQVEKRLQDFDKDLTEFQNLVLQHQDFTLKRASIKREAKEVQENERRKSLNADQALQHQHRIRELEKVTRQQLNDLHQSIQQKHRRFEDNLSVLVNRKERDIIDVQREREKRLQKTHSTLNKMDDEMNDYHKELLAYREIKLEHADHIVNQNLMKKKQKIQEERFIRDKTHRLNLSKVIDGEEAKTENLRSSIAFKDAKSQSILDEREIVTNQLRNKALQSQQLREVLLSKYERDSFDKKVQKVELESKVGQGHQSGYKNLTTFKIGI